MSSTITREHRIWQAKILISTYLGYGGFYLTRKVFTLCKTPIVNELGWELGSTAHIWTAFLIAYMMGQFINSYLGRRWGPRVLLLGGLGFSMGCNIVFGFSNSFVTYLVFMAFNGLVQAAGWPGCVGAISEWLSVHERGRLIGIWTTNHILGNIVVKTLTGMFLGITGLFLGMAGWRWAFFGCTGVTFLVWWLLYFWQYNKPEDVGLDPLVSADELAQQSINASKAEHVSFVDYARIAFHPMVLTMGIAYFCVKFLRYALDSWLPSFLTIQGLDPAQSSYYSMGFDIAGLAGTIVAGFMLDKWFRGNWAALSLVLGIGAIGGYLSVMYLGTSPIKVALCYCIVGFMLYGPDMLLSSAGAVEIAGAKNGVAIAGIVNGLGSIGPVVQEQVIGLLIRGDVQQGMANTDKVTLGTSIVMTLLLVPLVFRLIRARRDGLQNDI